MNVKNVDELVKHKENQQLDHFINKNYDVSILLTIIQILFLVLLQNKLNTQNNKPTT